MKDDLKFFNFPGLGFELTTYCPIKCRSCLRECVPERGKVLSFSQIRQVLDNIGPQSSFREIGFSGGECFLFPDLLNECCKYIQDKLGIPITMATNGYWAKTPELTKKLLSRLCKYGLDSLLVSVDDFHLEFIGAEKIINCVEIARELGLDITLQVITSRSSRKIPDFQSLFDFDSDDKGIKWIDNPCDPIGRASYEIPVSEFEYAPLPERSICSVFRIISVRIDGSVNICCGTGAEAPGMIVGNAFKESIDDIITRVTMSPVLNSLALYGGPQYLLKTLNENGINDHSQNNYTSPCEACYSLFTDIVVLDKLDSILESERYSLMATRLGWQYKLITVLKDRRRKEQHRESSPQI